MAILAQLQRFFHSRPSHAQHLYIALVEQARNPYFYEKAQVPDSLDGRFDMIVLHLFMVLESMKQRFSQHPEWETLSGEVIEYFISDMDRSLREMGASDTGIGRRVQKMTAAFYGRIDIYRTTLGKSEELKQALRRNIYGTVMDISDETLESLAAYITASMETLKEAEILDQDGNAKLAFASLG